MPPSRLSRANALAADVCRHDVFLHAKFKIFMPSPKALRERAAPAIGVPRCGGRHHHNCGRIDALPAHKLAKYYYPALREARAKRLREQLQFAAKSKDHDVLEVAIGAAKRTSDPQIIESGEMREAVKVPLQIPARIVLADGERVRREMRGFVKGDLKTCQPKNFVSYATGRRKDPKSGKFTDAEGTGPGMYHALWVARVLENGGQDCFSGLCVSGGAKWKIFLDKLGGAAASVSSWCRRRRCSIPGHASRRSIPRCRRASKSFPLSSRRTRSMKEKRRAGRVSRRRTWRRRSGSLW